MSISQATPISDSTWALYVQNDDPGTISDGEAIAIASSMEFVTQPVAGEAGQQFPTQPVVRILDASVST